MLHVAYRSESRPDEKHDSSYSYNPKVSYSSTSLGLSDKIQNVQLKVNFKETAKINFSISMLQMLHRTYLSKNNVNLNIKFN